MALNPGISWYNCLSFQLLWLFAWIDLSICFGNMSFILEDENYYNYDKSVAGGVFGKAGAIVQGIVFVIGIFLGPAFDIIGRKKLLIAG